MKVQAPLDPLVKRYLRFPEDRKSYILEHTYINMYIVYKKWINMVLVIFNILVRSQGATDVPPGAVHVAGVFRLHDSLVVVQFGLDHSIPDGLGHNELGVVRTVQKQLLGNVSEGDLAVGERDGLDGGLDDVVVEPGDQSVGVVRPELLAELLHDLPEPHQVAGLDGLGQLQVGVEGGLELKYFRLKSHF